MLIKYECRCIALGPSVDDRGAMIIRPCDTDRDDPEYSLFFRDQTGKTFEPLSVEEETEIFRELGKLVADGNNFRELKVLLRL